MLKEKIKFSMTVIRRHRFLLLAAFLLPVAVWIFLFRRFLSGQIVVNLDTQLVYTQLKYYMNNLANGVFPLWEPFVFLGRPFYSVALNGTFNPILYFMLFLCKVGANYYDGFMVYLVGYLLIGMIGFYFLSKIILNSRSLAFLAFVLLLFSGMSVGIFTHSVIVLIFVPAVWFFYFLLQFSRYFRRGDFGGLIFSAMLGLASYIPFYFATLLLVFLFVSLGFYFKEWIGFIAKFAVFCRKNVFWAVLGFLAMGISALPLILFKVSDMGGEMVSPARHCTFRSPEACYKYVMRNDASMSYHETARTGNLGERFSFKELFSHLDKKSFNTDDFFYVPFFSLMVIWISLWTPFDRKRLLIFITGCILFLISLGEATPVHRILYDHIFYFKYFRNLYFFSIFLMPLLVLFSIMQLKSMLEYKISSSREKADLVILTFILHVLLFIYLFSQGDILRILYITLGSSLVFFIVYFINFFNKYRAWLMPGLFILAMMQPIQVFRSYVQNAAGYSCEIPSAHVSPTFSYTRPTELVENDCPVYRYRPYIIYWYDMAMQDAPGIINVPERVARGVYFISYHVEASTLLSYAKNKFYVYDNVDSRAVEDNVQRLRDILANNENMALVAERPGAPSPKRLREGIPKQALVIDGPFEKFNVSQFNVNSLQLITNFETEKFLVYTDSFTNQWEVFINGEKSHIYLANGAFKGFWLPAGKNVVDLKFAPWGGSGIYVFIILFFHAFFIYTLVVLYRERKQRDSSGFSPGPVKS